MRLPLRLPHLLLVLATLGPAVVHPARAQEDAATITARQRFQEGVRYFDTNQYAKARVSFTQAYALKQHPAVLLNLAQSELRVPGYEVEAANHFAEYIRQVPDSAQRGEAEAALKEAQAKILTVNVEVDVKGAEVLVDGKHHAFTPIPDPVFLKAGTYVIEVRSEDGTKSETVTGGAGDDVTVTFAFAAPAPAAVPPSEAAEEGGEERAAPRAHDGRTPFFVWLSRRPGAVFLGLLSPIGVAGGVGFLIAAKDERDSANQIAATIQNTAAAQAQDPTNTFLLSQLAVQGPCGDGGSLPPIQAFPGDTGYLEACQKYYDTVAQADDFELVSYVSFGAAGAATAGLIVYYLVDTRPGKKDDHRASRVEVLPLAGPGFGGLGLSGRF